MKAGSVRSRWSERWVLVPIVFAWGCSTTSTMQQRRSLGTTAERVVLREPNITPYELSYEVRTSGVSGQLLWSSRCVLESTQESEVSTWETRGPHVGAGVAWLVGSAVAFGASGALFAASASAAPAESCVMPEGESVLCSSDKGTLLGAGVGLATLGVLALATGTTTLLLPEQKEISARHLEQESERRAQAVACGRVRDWAGAELALLQGERVLSRGFVDTAGSFLVAFPLESSGEEEPLQLVLEHVPVTLSDRVNTPTVLASFPASALNAGSSRDPAPPSISP